MKAVEGWKTEQLGVIIKDIGDGGTPNTNKKEYFGGSIPWVVIQDICKNINTTKTTLTPLGLKSCSAKLWPAGSVILSTGATIGEVGLAKIPVATKQGIHGIVCKEELSSNFLYYKLQTLREFLNANAQGSTIREVRANFLRTIPISFPISKPEQAKIAEILSTVDRTIEQTEALIAKQQRIKIGLMQDLLTRGIDEHGNLRSEQTHKFKDSPLGRIPVEWEVCELDTVAEFVTSGSRGWAQYYSAEGAMFLRIGNLTRDHINLRFEDMVFVSPPKAAEGKRTSVSTGDLLVSITADLGIIGVIPERFGEGYVNQHIARVRLIPIKINVRFIGWFLSGQRGQEQFEKLNESGAKAGLNLPTIKKLLVPVMKLTEQARIAEILDANTNRVNDLCSMLSKLCSLKTALMQDLLTGRKRVTSLMTDGMGLWNDGATGQTHGHNATGQAQGPAPTTTKH